MNEKKELIISTLEEVIEHYEATIASLRSPEIALNNLEDYLMSNNISFVECALRLGYSIVKKDGTVLTPEILEEKSEEENENVEEVKASETDSQEEPSEVITEPNDVVPTEASETSENVNTEARQENNENKVYSEDELQALTKQEIADLIIAIKPDFEVSITNVTKPDLIAEYQLLTEAQSE